MIFAATGLYFDGLFRHVTYFAFFQAIVLLLIYIMSSRQRKSINGYLIFLVLVLLVGLCGHIFYLEGLFGGSRRWVGLSEFSILFFGPTIYLFVRSSLTAHTFSYRDLVHYIPGLAYGLIITFYYMLPSSAVINERIESGELFRVVTLLVGSGLVVNLSYYILSVLSFVQLREALQEQVSYHLRIQFLRNFLWAIGFCFAVWLTIYISSLVGWEDIERVFRRFIWLTIAMLILFIMFHQLLSPEVLQYRSLIRPEKYSQSRLSQVDLDRLKAELDDIMERKKPHLNAKLMKADLAKMLDVNNPELSRLLNERIGMNFYEYVNYFRIQEFIQRARTHRVKEMTLLAIAQESGFNSKATFNKSFKKIMGCSPSEYLNRKK
ncbi:MAG: helix-turn-helix domain-containing protein [Saprospiraceae bacterium]|nr:helix-turn-helix domain-containing protein [Saprospiraceae bacterium]